MDGGEKGWGVWEGSGGVLALTLKVCNFKTI